MLEDILPYNNLPLDSINALDNHFDDFVEYSDKYGTNFVKVFSTYPQYADDIIKYISNDGIYAIDIIDKFGENGIEYANISSEKMFKILATNRGSRPDVSTYLSSDYINKHLDMFKDGVTVIQTESAYKKYSLQNGFVGVPDDNTLFVMPKRVCDEIIKNSHGDIAYIEKALGFEPGHLSGGTWRIDIDDVSNLNLRLPNGNETGAGSYWIPGGYTSGGISEAVSDTVPLSEVKVTRLS